MQKGLGCGAERLQIHAHIEPSGGLLHQRARLCSPLGLDPEEGHGLRYSTGMFHICG